MDVVHRCAWRDSVVYIVCLHCDVTEQEARAPGGASVKSIQLLYTRTAYVFY